MIAKFLHVFLTRVTFVMHQCTLFSNIDAILSLFSNLHINARFAILSEAENLIDATQCQNNLVMGMTKFCANLKQKTQILSVLIAHANTVPIAPSTKYDSAKCK